MPLTNHLNNQFVILLADNRINAALLEAQLDQYHHLVCARQQNEIFRLTQTLTFNLILLAFNKNTLELISLIKTTDCINCKTPVIALMNSNEAHQRQELIDAGFDDCLIEKTSEKQVSEVIYHWRTKNSAALNYIRIIQNKTKHNQRLTLTIFNKLFEELPWQIATIEEALSHQHYSLAEETVHKLHGSVSFCDLEDIREPALALENCLINKNYEGINQHFLMLQERTLKFTSHQQSILANLYKHSVCE